MTKVVHVFLFLLALTRYRQGVNETDTLIRDHYIQGESEGESERQRCRLTVIGIEKLQV